MNEHELIDRALRGLPPVDVPPASAARIRAAAYAELRVAARRTRFAVWLGVWDRALEPALASLVAVAYLGWLGRALWPLVGGG